MKPVTIIRHIACEGPGYLENTLEKYKIPVRLIAIDQGDTLPETPQDTAGLIIMGGPMSVNDDDEWIGRETLIRTVTEGLGARDRAYRHQSGPDALDRFLSLVSLWRAVESIR